MPDEIAGVLPPGAEEALAALRRDGIAVLPFDRLVGDAELWRALQVDVDGFVGSIGREIAQRVDAPKSKHDFLIRRYRSGKGADAPPDKNSLLAPTSALLRFALRETLDIVNTYRGEATKLVEVDEWYTVPYAVPHDPVASQRWHRDPEDQHVVKVFVYFSDVDEAAGPFQYVRGSAAGGPYGDLWPWGQAEGWYPPPEEFEAKIPESARFSATGPAGTVIMCDTSGFHRGGIARTDPRILATFTYVSPASTQRRKFLVARDGAESLTARQRYALA